MTNDTNKPKDPNEIKWIVADDEPIADVDEETDDPHREKTVYELVDRVHTGVTEKPDEEVDGERVGTIIRQRFKETETNPELKSAQEGAKPETEVPPKPMREDYTPLPTAQEVTGTHTALSIAQKAAEPEAPILLERPSSIEAPAPQVPPVSTPAIHPPVGQTKPMPDYEHRQMLARDAQIAAQPQEAPASNKAVMKPITRPASSGSRSRIGLVLGFAGAGVAGLVIGSQIFPRTVVVEPPHHENPADPSATETKKKSKELQQEVTALRVKLGEIKAKHDDFLRKRYEMFKNKGNYRAALKALDERLELEPGNIDLLQEKAETYAEMGRLGKAIKFLEQLLEGNEENKEYDPLRQLLAEFRIEVREMRRAKAAGETE